MPQKPNFDADIIIWEWEYDRNHCVYLFQIFHCFIRFASSEIKQVAVVVQGKVIF